ncbi:hypothetical protein [Thermogutta sp.]|jgi:hypothetical protein|uniref:hypothetical protein n=1 Tax=Thermogutta sp. TaxID=1962930 RepID=UPI00321F7915
MGLLEKRNPYATLTSVLLAALRGVIMGIVFFLLYFKPKFQLEWPITLPPWLLLCAIVFTLWEWQVPPDDELDNPEDETIE